MSTQTNGFLRHLSPSDQAALSAVAHIRSFPQGVVLAEIGDPIDRVFFVNSGMISVVVPLEDGTAIEAGVVGHNDVFGGSAGLGAERHVGTAVMQMAGWSSVVSAADLKRAADASPALRRSLAIQEQFMLSQAQQSAACNGRHSVRQRLATWLLRISDGVQQDELELTQEYLSQMLGVQRASVSLMASALREEGMITYKRGRIRILERQKLEHASCECYAALRRQYERTVRASVGSGAVQTSPNVLLTREAPGARFNGVDEARATRR